MIRDGDRRLPLALTAGLLCGAVAGWLLGNPLLGIPPGLLLGALLHRALQPEP